MNTEIIISRVRGIIIKNSRLLTTDLNRLDFFFCKI